jgi:hypothetical protein
VTKSGAGTGTVTSSPAGIGCGTICVATYANGTTVRLTAHAATRSRFQSWSGACSGRSGCVLSMTANRSVRAIFAKAFTPPRCVVPKVLGKTVAAATTAIRRAHCRLGKITRVPSIRSKIGKVLRQSPTAGRRLANGTKVNLAVGRGPARKK